MFTFINSKISVFELLENFGKKRQKRLFKTWLAKIFKAKQFLATVRFQTNAWVEGTRNDKINEVTNYTQELIKGLTT